MATAPPFGLPLVTVVCPVFNEEHSIRPFYDRLIQAMAPTASRVRFELLFVNNRSTDRTVEIIHELQAADGRVHLITLSRNYGYQASITAGMRQAMGDAIVNIDVDCEDPPEMIPLLIQKWMGGADIAYGIRDKREEFILMHLGRKLFYRVMKKVADHDIVLDMAEFFLVDKRVRDVVLSTRSTFPFVRGQVGYVGFRREGIPYKRQRRLVGKTHYNLISAARFGVGGILSSSTLALRLLAYFGTIAFIADLGFGAWLLLSGGTGLSTWQRLVYAGLLLQVGWAMLAFGALGIYVARIYKDTIGLPLYVVDDRISTYRSSASSTPNPTGAR
jgi:polyisoprenyl-phosphate glycosyltransferase